MPTISNAIDRCYSTGLVSGTGTNPTYLYGLIGYLDYTYLPSPTISKCLWDTTTSGKTSSYGGMGYTTEEMQEKFRYELWNSWDFTTVWAICEGTNYPRLRWQIHKSDILCPDGVGFDEALFIVTRWLAGNCENTHDCDGADISGNGLVDLADFSVLAAEWLSAN